MVGILTVTGLEIKLPFLPDVSTIYFTVVNIFSFYVLHRILRKEGSSIKSLIGFRSELLLSDILYGFLWLFVLYIPFVAAVIGTMFLMYGTDLFNNFEVVFAGNIDTTTGGRPSWLIWLAACTSLIFPFINAPIEELMYRGYAQTKFSCYLQQKSLAILIPSLGFALQHVMLAASVQGAIVYAVSFFVWGISSGIIFHKQKRLLPLIICHFIVNIAFSIFPIIMLITGAY